MFYPFLEHKNYFLMAFSICKVTLECHEDVVFVLFSAISVCHSLMTTQHLCWLQLFSCKSNMCSLLTYKVRTFLFWPQWSFLFDLNGLFFLTSMVFSFWPQWSFLFDLNGLFFMWLAQLDNHPFLYWSLWSIFSFSVAQATLNNILCHIFIFPDGVCVQ